MGINTTAIILKVIEVAPRFFMRSKPPVIDYTPLYDTIPDFSKIEIPEAGGSGEISALPFSLPVTVAAPISAPPSNTAKVSTSETMDYQRRELGKEFLLLEKHLQQLCQINGKACDCCEKHPIAIEALAQEALGISGDQVFAEVAGWARQVAPITTEEAAASGNYNDQYPQLAVQARNLRKRILGTTDPQALLSPELQEKVKADVKTIIRRAMSKEGGEDVGSTEEMRP